MSSTVPLSRTAGSDRRTVLLTGASGLVGQAVLDRLRDVDVICLTHRTPVDAPHVRSVASDIGAPALGLEPRVWRELAAEVDVVIHAAALTHFNGSDEALTGTNVDGTANVLDFSAAAGAAVYHVSTAYLHAREQGERGRKAVRYAATKRAGEELVRNSGLPATILRPSIVLGDSVTGEASVFQGIYHVADAILRGALPVVPFDPTWPIDVVPRDVVADSIVTLVERGHVGGELWLSSGSRAPSLADAVDMLLELATEFGVDAPRPRFVSPEMFDRLIAPVFLPSLPPELRVTATRMLDLFAAYLALDEPLPSSLPDLEGVGVLPLPDPIDSLRRSFRYWAQCTGVGDTAEEDVA